MSDVQELERGILAARDRGDVATLERLQDRYRNSALVTRVSGPGSIRLIERSAPASAPEAPPAPETGTLPSVVRLRPEAYSTIVNWPYELGMECGGYLAGYESDGEIVVEGVFAADESNPVGERERIVLSHDWLDVVNDRIGGAGWHVVGDAHSHVNAEPKLSKTDRWGLRRAADAMKQNWIGLVIARDQDRVGWSDEWLWVKPTINAFIAVYGDRSVSPVDLIVEQDPA